MQAQHPDHYQKVNSCNTKQKVLFWTSPKSNTLNKTINVPYYCITDASRKH